MMRPLLLPVLLFWCAAPSNGLTVASSGATVMSRVHRAAPLSMTLGPGMSTPSRKSSRPSKEMPRGVPPAIADRISFATSGVKTANQIEEIGILWKTFKGCYKSEALAVEAVTKNAAVLQPQYNSPRKIKGTYKLLQQRFGKKGATDIITRNPGVLICSPEAMAKQSDQEIMKAVELVEWTYNNKGAINLASQLYGILLIIFISYGVTAKGHPEYGLWLWGMGSPFDFAWGVPY